MSRSPARLMLRHAVGGDVWIWRVDGKLPPDEIVLADARRPAGDLDARAGVLTVRPVRRLPDTEAR